MSVGDDSRISVVIPCYNQGHFLKEAIASVMAQSRRADEVVVVNDGSTDALTLEVFDRIASAGISVLHQANKGLSGARNAGIIAASGEYILPLDADDRLAPTYIEKTLALLQSDDRLGIAYTGVQFFGDKHRLWNLADFSLERELRSNIIPSTALYRKKHWQCVGGYDESFTYWEDYDFWLSLLSLGLGASKVPEPLFYYRKHASAMTSHQNDVIKFEKQKAAYAMILRKHQTLYMQHPDVLAEALVEKPAPPKNAQAKLRRYKILRRIYGMLACLPGLTDLFLARQDRIEAKSRQIQRLLTARR